MAEFRRATNVTETKSPRTGSLLIRRLHSRTKSVDLLMTRPVILVVEDEALIMLMLADCLDAYGYEVLTAPSARAALEILSTCDNIEVLFTDLDLRSHINGTALARLARETHPGIGVVYTSGRYPSMMADSAVRGSRFLPKPYRVPTLLDEIEIALSWRMPSRGRQTALRVSSSAA